MLAFISPRLTLVNAALLAVVIASCGPELPQPPESPIEEGDVHTYANTDQVRVSHIDLDLTVDFEAKQLRGNSTLHFERTRGTQPMVLDTRALEIEKVEMSPDGEAYTETTFEMGKDDPILGAPLRIDLPMTSGTVRVHYTTTAGSTALQWLDPRQTAGKRQPFLFTQSEAIHARSWIPLQDTPSVKTPYSAHIRTPAGLRAVMSASNDPNAPVNGDYRFEMPQPVPSYLIALAVGDLEFRPLGGRTGVYAEKPVVAKAAAEFEDTEKMLVAAEGLFGRYPWGRYDILVLPPSFPFGGMENPRLTFATPTVLAGDKSLVSLIAHEMAHSWAGNLVTNATWSDFWLNEGFTVYLEGRILEAVYGADRAAMEAVLGRRSLTAELARLPDKDEILHVDLRGRDPDDGFTDVPYQKGALFLRTLEAAYGRNRLDKFLRGYFETFAFQSITTRQFLQELQFGLLNTATDPRKVPVKEWVYEPGIPDGAWEPTSRAFAEVEKQAADWVSGDVKAADLRTAGWSTQEWLHFLELVPEETKANRLGALDRAFGFTRTGNSEILCKWLVMTTRGGYHQADQRLREFLTSQGRRKFLMPLYGELAKTPAGRERALAIYRVARPGYHPIASASVDELLGWTEDPEQQ